MSGLSIGELSRNTLMTHQNREIKNRIEVLSEQIDKGEISEIEAKAKWQKLYLDLGSTERDAPN